MHHLKKNRLMTVNIALSLVGRSPRIPRHSRRSLQNVFDEGVPVDVFF
jgi:hypothetical protein